MPELEVAVSPPATAIALTPFEFKKDEDVLKIRFEGQNGNRCVGFTHLCRLLNNAIVPTDNEIQ